MKKVLLAVLFVLVTATLLYAAPVWDRQSGAYSAAAVKYAADDNESVTAVEMAPGAVFDNILVDSDNATWNLPACTADNAGATGTFVSAVSTHKVFLDPASGDKIMPTGTADQLVLSSGTIGDSITIRCAKSGASTWDWIRLNVIGTWSAR